MIQDDVFVKSPKKHFLSFPWKREFGLFRKGHTLWIPAFTGMTIFYETIIYKGEKYG